MTKGIDDCRHLSGIQQDVEQVECDRFLTRNGGTLDAILVYDGF